jgi:hypothetical protein
MPRARAKELKIRVDDRQGMLGEIALALGDKHVNLRALNAWVEDGQGVVRMVVDKLGPAKRALKAHGWNAEEEEVLEVELTDKPGALGQVAKALADAGIDIRYVFGGAAGARKAAVFMGVSDLKSALKALR